MADKRTRAKQSAPQVVHARASAEERVADAAWAAETPAEAAAPAPVGEASPSMAQFLEIKAAHPDSLLWYRMGDFYELFFDDAVAASATLGIVLTKRGKHLGQDIPMCGVPIHRADEYLQRLIKAGHRVAVAEQLEDPAEARKRGSKAVVRRDVVRLVTPGTMTEDTLLDSKARNYPHRAVSCWRTGRGVAAGCGRWRSPRSTFRPANSRSARSRAPICRASWRALRRAR